MLWRWTKNSFDRKMNGNIACIQLMHLTKSQSNSYEPTMTDKNGENIHRKTDVFIGSAPVTHASSVISLILRGSRMSRQRRYFPTFRLIKWTELKVLMYSHKMIHIQIEFILFLFSVGRQCNVYEKKVSGGGFVCVVSSMSISQSKKNEQFIFARYSVFAKYRDRQCGWERNARSISTSYCSTLETHP